MIGRLLFKVIVFALIIAFFLYYQANNEEKNTDQNSASYLSNLILKEQQLIKELNLETNQTIPHHFIVTHNLPHIEGTLIRLSQKDDHIVLAKVLVHEAYEINVKPEKTISIIYTGHLSDIESPTVNEKYIWIIQEHSDSDSAFFIQGGKQGILQLP